MNSRKNIPLVLSILIITVLCLALSGCSDDRDSLQRILADKHIVFGVEPDKMPLSFEAQDEPQGLSVDIARELAYRLDVEAEFLFVSASDAQQALDDGTIDLFINLPSPGQKETAALQTVDTGIDYRQILVVPSDSDVSRLYDLKGGTLCIISGSDASAALDKAEVFKSDLGGIVWCDIAGEQFDALASGRADAMLVDEPVYLYIMNGVDSDYVVLEDVIARTRLIIAMRQHDIQLSQRIRSLFDDMRSDGTFDRIRSGWIG